ncbi:UNVERIFIED_CONTAM: hypothetical protein K2H54_060068 [Gekko kuhli]
MKYKNHREDGPDVKITLMNGDTPKNGLNSEHLDAKEQGACQMFKKKSIIITIIIVLFLLFLGSVIGNIIQADWKSADDVEDQCFVVTGKGLPGLTDQTISVPKKQSQATPNPLDGCPHGWIKKEDSCYFVSEGQQEWDFSQSNCSSYGASMVTLDSELEWALVKSKQDEFWIDLQRQKVDQPWKWRNGSDVAQFKVEGTGLCGYTNGDTVSSTTCNNTRRWMCKKPVHAA